MFLNPIFLFSSWEKKHRKQNQKIIFEGLCFDLAQKNKHWKNSTNYKAYQGASPKENFFHLILSSQIAALYKEIER